MSDGMRHMKSDGHLPILETHEEKVVYIQVNNVAMATGVGNFPWDKEQGFIWGGGGHPGSPSSPEWSRYENFSIYRCVHVHV